MLRPFQLPMISLCILLLTASHCSKGCETMNNGDTLLKLQNQYTTINNKYQDLEQQFQEMSAQGDAILQAKQDLDQLMALKEELERKLAELQQAGAPQLEIDAIKQRLKDAEENIANKQAELQRLEEAIKKAQNTADIAHKQAGTAKDSATKAATAAGNAQKTADTLQKEFEAFKKGLQVQIGGIQNGLAACAKASALDPIKEDIEQLKKGLLTANQQIAKAATQEQLELAKKEVENKIGEVQENLATTQEKLQEDIKDSKAAAIAASKELATDMVEKAKQEMKQSLATKQELQDAIDQLQQAQKQKAPEEQEKLKALEEKCKGLHTQIGANQKKAEQEFAKMQDHAKRIADLEKNWNGTAKTKLDEADRKATEAINQLKNMPKPSVASPTLTKEQIKDVLNEQLKQKEKEDREKLGKEMKSKLFAAGMGLSDENSIHLAALNLALKVSKQLEALKGRLDTLDTIAVDAKKGTMRFRHLDTKPIAQDLFKKGKEEQPEDFSKNKDKTSPSKSKDSTSNQDTYYQWPNSERLSLIDAVHEIQRELKAAGVKLQKSPVKLKGPSYEDRLEKLEEKITEIKDLKEQVKSIKKLSNLLNGSKNGSLRLSQIDIDFGNETTGNSLSKKTAKSILEKLKNLQ